MKSRDTISQVTCLLETPETGSDFGFMYFCVFFTVRFWHPKRVSTNRHATVCDGSWTRVLGSKSGPCFEMVFFCMYSKGSSQYIAFLVFDGGFHSGTGQIELGSPVYPFCICFAMIFENRWRSRRFPLSCVLPSPTAVSSIYKCIPPPVSLK